MFSCIMDTENIVHFVFDKDVINVEYYGCSDGLTTSYMKVRTDDIVNKLLPYSNHKLSVIEV